MRLLLALISLSLALMAHAAGGSMPTNNLAGIWQGMLKVGPQELRIVLKLTPVSSVIWDGSSLTLKVDAVHGTYSGQMSADGGSLNGTWSQGPPLPLELTHATKQAAWPLDPSPHRIQFVTVDKDVKLEVLDWGGTGRPVVGPLPGVDASSRAAMEARDKATTEAQVAAFESGLPSAHVARIPHANHFVFLTNEADVLKEMHAFIAGLPPPQ